MSLSQNQINWSACQLTACKVAIYPLEVLATNNLAQSKPNHLFSGAGALILQRFLKSSVTLHLFNNAQNVAKTDSKALNAALSGAATGAVEAMVLNPMEVVKNHLQVTSKSTVQTIRELRINQLTKGSIQNVGRNIVFSFVSIGTFYTSTHKEARWHENSAAGAFSFFIGGCAILPIESSRLRSVLNLNKNNGYLKNAQLLWPLPLKWGITGALYAKPLHAILFSEKKLH
jgi:hypothetical protein